MISTNKFLGTLILVTLLFLLAIALDITPYLRGPAPYPPEWRWEYYFINTIHKSWLPILNILLILGVFWLIDKKKAIPLKHEKMLLLFLIITSFLFQMSILFFSRSGIGVLIHRIINPELNGYFTAALTINNIPEFLHGYNQEMLQFVYHAKAHPPGAILFFYFIKQFLSFFPPILAIINQLAPAHTDVRAAWNILLPAEKATAIFSSFLIPVLSNIALIPLYYATKIIYNSKIALRASFIYIFIPSLVFFIPINDAFLPIFSILAFFYMIKGFRENKARHFFLSAATIFIGVFFNLSFLPLLVFFFFVFMFSMFKKKLLFSKIFFKQGISFSLGLCLPPILLFVFFQLNFIETIFTIMKYVPDIHTRSYQVWIFYNLYDFFIFSGIPLAIIFLTSTKQLITNCIKKLWGKADILLASFLLMIIILNFSGSVRGETGRLWSVYIPFIVILGASYITNKIKFSTKFFTIVLLLQAVQVLVMQEFWVMLW